MAELHMLIGVAGSGKSTFALDLKELREKSGIEVKIHSSDALRKELYGDENDQTHNKEIFEELHKRMIADLEKDKIVIYDACNLTFKDRMRFLNKIPKKLKVTKICHIIPITFEDAIRRQQCRDRQVPAEVIKKQMCRFQTPWFHEGWQHIGISFPGEDCHEIDLDAICFQYRSMEHDNPHHSKTILAHCEAAQSYGIKKGFREAVTEAAKYHDIGKFFTKDFKDSRGNPSEFAHYYGHQNYGAYLVLLSKQRFSCGLLILSFLICYHMEEFLRKTNIDTFYNKLNDPQAVEDLKNLHLCDLAAH